MPLDGTDTQIPHSEDEIYVVVSGRAELQTPEATVAVQPGSVVFVPAHEDHRFVNLDGTADGVGLFAPPEGARAKVPSV